MGAAISTSDGAAAEDQVDLAVADRDANRAFVPRRSKRQHPSVRMELVTAAQAQARVDQLAGQGRLAVPVPGAFSGRSTAQDIVGY
jgi:hypothetical protein